MSMEHKFLLVSIVGATALFIGLTSTTTLAEDNYPPPPYLNQNNEHVLVGVTLDETAVRAMLPPGIEPAEGITGGINMYLANAGYGLAPYTASYIWVDIEGFDSADGSKGRWLLRGFYGPEIKVPQALVDIYGLPVVLGVTELSAAGSEISAVGRVDDVDIMSVTVSPDTESCNAVAGTLNYPGVPPTGQGVVVNEIPWSGEFCLAELVALDIKSGGGEFYEGLEPTSITWVGIVKDGGASFSRPVSAQ